MGQKWHCLHRPHLQQWCELSSLLVELHSSLVLWPCVMSHNTHVTISDKTWLLPSHGNHSCHLHATSEIPRTCFHAWTQMSSTFFIFYILFYFIFIVMPCRLGCSPYQTLEYSYSQLMAICLLHMFFDLSIGFRHWSAKQVCLWEAMGWQGMGKDPDNHVLRREVNAIPTWTPATVTMLPILLTCCPWLTPGTYDAAVHALSTAAILRLCNCPNLVTLPWRWPQAW